MINREVVSLTGELHEYSEEDEKRLKSLVREIEEVSSDERFDEAVIHKASLLIYRIATGQHFHEGNKRTALVAGLAFLKMNGRSIDVRREELVSVVDKAGIGAASLNDVEEVIRKLIRNEPEGT